MLNDQHPNCGPLQAFSRVRVGGVTLESKAYNRGSNIQSEYARLLLSDGTDISIKFQMIFQCRVCFVHYILANEIECFGGLQHLVNDAVYEPLCRTVRFIDRSVVGQLRLIRSDEASIVSAWPLYVAASGKPHLAFPNANDVQELCYVIQPPIAFECD